MTSVATFAKWETQPKPKGEIFELLSADPFPAFATDDRDRIVFWNRGAEKLFGIEADDAMGRRCHEVVQGRDSWGNRFCSESCPFVVTAKHDETIHGCDMYLPALKPANRSAGVTILRIPGVRKDLFTLVHILRPFDESSRLAAALEKMSGEETARTAAAPPTVRASQPAAPPSAAPLTRRETELLQLIGRGLQNKEIASRLTLSLATVRNHIRNILGKLEAHSKLEAVSMAFRNGWIAEPSAIAGQGTPSASSTKARIDDHSMRSERASRAARQVEFVAH